MKDFDLKKFLIENKLTSNSRLNEGLNLSSPEAFLKSANMDPSSSVTADQLEICIRAWIEESLKKMGAGSDVFYSTATRTTDPVERKDLEEFVEDLLKHHYEDDDYFTKIAEQSESLAEAMEEVLYQDLQFEENIDYMFEEPALQQAKEGGFEPLGSIAVFVDAIHYFFFKGMPSQEWLEKNWD